MRVCPHEWQKWHAFCRVAPGRKSPAFSVRRHPYVKYQKLCVKAASLCSGVAEQISFQQYKQHRGTEPAVCLKGQDLALCLNSSIFSWLCRFPQPFFLKLFRLRCLLRSACNIFLLRWNTNFQPTYYVLAVHPGNKRCLEPHILRGRWEAKFKDSFHCRNSSGEGIACWKCPSGAREGSSCCPGGAASKPINFIRPPRCLLLPLAPLTVVIHAEYFANGYRHFRPREMGQTSYLEPLLHECTVQRMSFAWPVAPSQFAGADGSVVSWNRISLILYLNLTLETLKLVRCWIRRRIVTIYNGSGLHWHYFICWLSDLKQAEHAEDYIWQKSCDLVVHATEERRQPSGCAFTLVRLFP